MQYRRLGRAGVKVSRICLGAGVRGQLDEERFVRTVERAIDLGCNFIDCANNYGGRKSETLLGQAIKGKRGNLVITSKVFTRVGPGPNDQGLSRPHIMREVEHSLQKRRTESAKHPQAARDWSASVRPRRLCAAPPRAHLSHQ